LYITVIKVKIQETVYREVIVNCFFLHQKFLIQGETLRALRRLPGACVKALDITMHPTASQAAFAVEILKKGKCSVLFTVNEWGIDSDGIFYEFLSKNNVIHINWCVDDPFYEEFTGNKKFKSAPLRFDFVSDRDYMNKMIERGYQVSFLPLATDPALFYPEMTMEDKDVVFVGNSYLAQIDMFVEHVQDDIGPLVPFIASLIDHYKRDCLNIDLEQRIISYLEKNGKSGQTKSFEKIIFVCKQLAGYMYRKDIISGIVTHFPGCTIYGDDGWKQIIDSQKVKKVAYGDQLRSLYNTVRVNIDCNRAVIRDGLTQRPFDIMACKKFVITSNKNIVKELYETSGANKEIVMFRNRDELYDMVNYYLKNERERIAIAERGYVRVMNEHTYDHRIRSIFRTISKALKT
jgi:spore maturation protein CgeB